MVRFISKQNAVDVAEFHKKHGYRNLRPNDIIVSIRNNEDGTYSIVVEKKDIRDQI